MTLHSMSTRGYCTPKIPSSVLGVYVTAFPVLATFPKAQTDTEKFWEYAKAVQGVLHHKDIPGVISFVLKLMSFFKPSPPQPLTPQKEFGRMQSVPFNISNRGYYRAFDKSFGPYKLLGTYYATAEHIRGFPHCHNIVGFGNELHWSLIYYTHVSTLDQTIGYARTMLQLIDEACAKE
jgi:hypothetical protein